MKIFFPVRFLSLWSIALLFLAGQMSREIQAGPLETAQAIQSFVIAEDLKIELVAAEPQVIDPVHMAFDEQGRLWVVEMRDYPNGPKPGAAPESTIKILRDKDGDGVFEQATVFADKLLFATSLLPWKGGVIVAVSGQILWMSDDDGDDKVDRTEVWLEGFTQENPQLRANFPLLGPDGWIYISNGLRGGEVTVVHPDWPKLTAPISLRGKDFRFNPHTGECESIAGNGQYGATFDAWGNRIICSNRNPAMQVMFQFDQLAGQPLLIVPSLVNDISPSGEESRLFALTGNWTTSNLHAGQFTAACGVHSYQGQGLPEAFKNHVFCCDPTANLVHGDQLKIAGASFAAVNPHQPQEFLASKDDWFRPVSLTTGPDGALYVVDMYRAVIEHPQFMPDELKNRPDLLLGKDRGRIWRVSAKQNAPELKNTEWTVAPENTTKLLEWLTSSNVWQRQTAERIVSQTRPAELLPLLTKLAQQELTPAATGSVLSLLAQYNQLSPALLLPAFQHAAPEVRSLVVRLAEQQLTEQPLTEQRLNAADLAADEETALTAAIFQAIGDEHPHVRYRALIAARQQMDAQATAPQLLVKAVVSQQQPADNWIQKASLLGIQQQLPALLQEIAKVDSSGFSEAQKAALQNYTFEVSQLIGRLNEPAQVQATLALLWQEENSPLAQALIPAVIRGLGTGLISRRASLKQNLALPVRSGAAAVWSDQPAYQKDRELLLSTLKNSQSLADRLQAVSTLRFLPDESITSLLVEIARDRRQPGNLRTTALDALKGRPLTGNEAVVQEFVEMIRSESPQMRRELLDYCLSDVQVTRLMLREMVENRLNYRELANDQVTRLNRSQDPEVLKLHATLKEKLKDTNLEEVIATYRKALQTAELSEAQAIRGREVFRAQCAICHRFGEEGVQVGPDISDTRTKRPDELLISIVDPNRAIDNNYFSYTVVTIDGIVHTGVLAEETPFAITLRQAKGETRTIQREEIEEFASSGVSFMPAGLEKAINVEQMIDLISYLKNWRYLDGQVPLQQTP